MIKICVPGFPCTRGSARFFTVEARVKGGGAPTQYDNGIPGDGVIVHDVQFGRPAISGSCYSNNQSGWAVPVDATPGDYDSVACGAGGRLYPNYALYNAQFTTGQTYTNSTFHFRVDVLSRSGSSFAVAVQSAARASELNIDIPAAGATATQPIAMSGWALNRDASGGTGVDAVHVYAFPTNGAPSTFVGSAAYGQARPDVGNVYGAQFTNSAR